MIPVTIEDLDAELHAAIAADDHETIARVAAELDAMDAAEKARRPKPDLLASALWYAEQGLHVFPLAPGAKIPHKGSNGCKDATTDADTLRAWWEQLPGSNVGIATGHLVDVIDIDGLKGQISFGQNADAFKHLQVLGTVSTPRPGGMHLYIPATGAGNRAGILPGIDHRGLGGYVVAPPSANEQGTYVFIGGGLDLAAAAEAAVA